MLIRKIVILFIVGFFALGLAFYIVKNISPFELSKIQEIANDKEIKKDDINALDKEIEQIIERGIVFEYLNSSAYAAFFLFLLFVFFTFSSLHLLIDKLFFKKFFESPSNFNAFRRGFLLSIVLGIVIYMNLYGFDLPTIGIAALLGLLVEIMVLLFWNKKDNKTTQSEP